MQKLLVKTLHSRSLAVSLNLQIQILLLKCSCVYLQLFPKIALCSFTADLFLAQHSAPVRAETAALITKTVQYLGKRRLCMCYLCVFRYWALVAVHCWFVDFRFMWSCRFWHFGSIFVLKLSKLIWPLFGKHLCKQWYNGHYWNSWNMKHMCSFHKHQTAVMDSACRVQLDKKSLYWSQSWEIHIVRAAE